MLLRRCVDYDGQLDLGRAMNFEQAASRLVAMAQQNHGTVTATQVETDEYLTTDKPLVSAAARALAGGTNARSAQESDGRSWFPYSTLTFSDLYGKQRAGRRRRPFSL
jgi:hypothetical protein